jgi:hypothetical protein
MERNSFGHVPQGRRLFSDLTVMENLKVGLMTRGSCEDVLAHVLTLFPLLKERLGQRAGTMSGGEQQMLATARALCINPKVLPLGVWTLWWVVIVLLHPLFGNLWGVLDPFIGIHALLTGGAKPRLAYPASLSYWLAVLIFLAFAWFQLVYPAPEDVRVLALAVALYLSFTLLAVVLFGPIWLRRGDPFAVFLYQLGSAAPVSSQGFRLPGAGLLALPPLPLSGTLFVLLTLSSISFDGFANTFFWLS